MITEFSNICYSPAAVVVAALLAAGLSGCGGGPSGPDRYDISGVVKFDGQPVKFGTVIFEPDVASGNSGPQGTAEIVDGHYDTRSQGLGTVGGAMIIRVTGMDTKSDVSSDEPKQPLFSDYEVKLDLPKEHTTKDLDVPRSAADPKAPAPRQPRNNA